MKQEPFGRPLTTVEAESLMRTRMGYRDEAEQLRDENGDDEDSFNVIAYLLAFGGAVLIALTVWFF